ncbi:MAG TPA: DUF2442 domain-containing protein [Elusimicrobia bacterium]|nr:DUF2442 domain-containing protein [Elusimicrobiota bacterium]
MLDIIEAKHITGYKFEIVFENGEKSVVDLSAYARRGGVFSRFADPDYVKQAYVNKDLGTICWPGNIDIAPETLYRLSKSPPL